MPRWLSKLFGCRHSHTSRVFTRVVATPTGVGVWDVVKQCRVPEMVETRTHYVVCFDCSRELNYDWESLKLVD